MQRLLVTTLVLLAACGTGSSAGQASPGYRLFVEKLGGAGVSIVTTSSPARISLPGGFLTADGSQLFSSGGQVFGPATGSAGSTILNVFETRGGTRVRQLSLAGAWSWAGGGASPDGRWVVLTGSQRFLVVDTTTGRQNAVSLDGQFSFDALSNDGRMLYLIETLLGSAYQVRLYDMSAAALRPGAVVIKGPGEESMDGYRITSLADPSGHMLYSLYGRHDGSPPFVHALDLDNAVTYCIDLPAIATLRESYLDAGAAGWALSLDSSHHVLYASSPRGQVAAIDTERNVVSRSAALSAPPTTTGMLPWLGVDAAAKAFEATPAASVLDPSGRWLYVAWESGYLPVNTASLRPAALRDSGDHLTSLALSADGRHLFGIRGWDAVVDLDPQTGQRRPAIGSLTEGGRILRLEAAA